MEKILVLNTGASHPPCKLKELLYTYESENRIAIHRPFTSNKDPMQKKIISESDMIVLVAEKTGDMLRMLKEYPKDKYGNTICLLEERSFLRDFIAGLRFKNLVFCPKGQSYKALKGLMEIMTPEGVIRLDAKDILTFCKNRKTYLFYCESEKDLVKEELRAAQRETVNDKCEFLLHFTGDLSLSDISEFVDEMQDQTGENRNVFFGVGYKQADVVKTTLLVAKSRKNRKEKKMEAIEKDNYLVTVSCKNRGLEESEYELYCMNRLGKALSDNSLSGYHLMKAYRTIAPRLTHRILQSTKRRELLEFAYKEIQEIVRLENTGKENEAAARCVFMVLELETKLSEK